MPLHNGPHGYGTVTKILHWTTVAALIAQFTVGYLMDVEDSGRGRGRGRGESSGRGRGRGGEDDYLDHLDGALGLHVGLGVLILILAVARLLWRRTGLPPWAATLSPRERTVVHWYERALLGLLFAIPLSGLALVAAGEDDVLIWHIVTHLVFFAVLAVHVGLVVKHQLVNRDRLLSRMT